MADEEFFSFEEALTELHLKEEELKRLVSEGEIRAFREGETMRLRVSDVRNLRSELSGGEVVDLGDVGEELVFEDDLGLETGMATEEISDADTILEADVEDVGELDLEEDLDEVDAPAASAPSATRSVRRTASVPARAGAEEDQEEPLWMRGVMILTTVVLILGIPVCLSISAGEASEFASAIAGMFGG